MLMSNIRRLFSVQIAVPMTKQELQLINEYIERKGLKKGALTRRALLAFIREREIKE